jgi:hypothetical protein
VSTVAPLEDAVDRRQYDLRVLAAMGDQLASNAPVLLGPTRLVLELVSGATTHAVQTLAERLGQRRLATAHERKQLLRDAALAAAWVETLCDTQAVQWFSFDPDFDLPRP